MQGFALFWGICAVIGMLVGFFPCLGSLNWLSIPFAGLGFIVSVIAYARADEGNRGSAVAGILCCAFAAIAGLFRLMLGGGIM